MLAPPKKVKFDPKETVFNIPAQRVKMFDFKRAKTDKQYAHEYYGDEPEYYSGPLRPTAIARKSFK